MVAGALTMAPIIPVPLHAVAPQAQAQKNQPVSTYKLIATSPTCISQASGKPKGVQDNSSNNSNGKSVPKMEPFSRSRISRLMREPSLLKKAENALAERCTKLEGDEAYRCWEALFEFENIKEAYEGECEVALSDDRQTACRPLERFENLVRQSGGVSGLIDNIRMVAKTTKLHQQQPIEEPPLDRPVFPEDMGLPPPPVEHPTSDELGLLPESDLTRMLRHQGRAAAWFTHPPDHESD